MTELQPGSYAKWQPKHIWPTPRIGRVVGNEGPVIHLAVNGSTYEVDTRSEIVHPVNACRLCDRPVKFPASVYCSRECATRDRVEYVDDCVFGAIVEFKRQFGGLSPSAHRLVDRAGFARTTVNLALKRLAKAGKIYFVREGRHRQIGVVGERWTYADPD